MLATSTERIPGQVHERLNIIFIDPHYITRPVAHDYKLIDCKLDTFLSQLRQSITTLYPRKVYQTFTQRAASVMNPRVEPESIDRRQDDNCPFVGPLPGFRPQN